MGRTQPLCSQGLVGSEMSTGRAAPPRRAKMKPWPRVSWEGDGTARTSRHFSCNPSQSSPPPLQPSLAQSPREQLWSPGVWLLPPSLPPQKGLRSFRYPKAGQKLMRFGGGRTRDPVALFFPSQFPNFPTGRNWYPSPKPTGFLNHRSPQAGACRQPSFPPNSWASLSTRHSSSK